jgi:shikimate 5-dehydrogenase
MKWTEITDDPRRAQCLSSQLTNQGVSNELVCTAATGSAEELITHLQAEFGQIRFSPKFGAGIVALSPHLPILENQIQSCDALVFNHGKWWPRSFLSLALEQVFSESKKDLKLESNALILGTGAVARCASAALFKSGLRRFLVTAPDEGEGLAFCQTMSRHLLGVQFEWIPRKQIVSIPSQSSVVVNGTPVHAENEMLKELLYFNFIRPDGIVWDFSLNPLSHPFVEEAQALGVEVVRGYQIAARADALWASQVMGVRLDLGDYEKRLFEALSSNPQ